MSWIATPLAEEAFIVAAPTHPGSTGHDRSAAVTMKIAEFIRGAGYEIVEHASHSSMFAECKPGAAKIAMVEGIEDPICADGSKRLRIAIHAQLIDMATAAFDRSLTSNH